MWTAIRHTWRCSIILFYFFYMGCCLWPPIANTFLPILFFATEYPWTSVSHGGVPPHIGSDAPPEWCPFRGDPPMSDGSPRGFCLSWGGEVLPPWATETLGDPQFLCWKYRKQHFLYWKNLGSLFSARKKPLRARSHTLSIFDTYSLYFWYIEDLYRSRILRREQPSGVVQGLGIWRWWVRFPPPRGQVGVTFSSFFGCIGKCLGVVWGHF